MPCHYIKVNLPITEEEYISGNGEGVWVIVDDATKRDHDMDLTGKGYRGILDNDSVYYPGLSHGMRVAFELRGKARAVADYGLLSKYPHITPVAKLAIMKKIWEQSQEQ